MSATDETGIRLKKGSPVPEWYRCQDCGAIGVKLWHRRLYQTVNHPQKLQCCKCAGLDWWNVDDTTPAVNNDLVPAVPKAPFWNHFLISEGGMEWWGSLPNKKDDTGVVIENNGTPFQLEYKRCFMPIVLKVACPECGRKCERDFSSSYLSYPTANEPFDLHMACFREVEDEDGDLYFEEEHEFTITVRFNVTLEHIPDGS